MKEAVLAYDDKEALRRVELRLRQQDVDALTYTLVDIEPLEPSDKP